ncbi:MAG: HD domain-containing protein [Clostridia bacterium]|nr:HD domain-containing protein [Clostridia bacterium]
MKNALIRANRVGLELLDLERRLTISRADAFVVHGDTTCLMHCIGVALVAMAILDGLRLRYDRRSLIRGALLHDFYLYDWHTHKRAQGERMHAFTHGAAALRNAEAEVDLTPVERDVILRHMFPVTLTPPRTREGLAVTLADKLCALYETFSGAPYKKTAALYRRCLNRGGSDYGRSDGDYSHQG